MTKLTKRMLIAAMVISPVVATTAQAEYLGLLSGRSANPGNMTDLSVEVGLITGDFGSSDYQNIGARVNYRLSPEMVLFGDFGISEIGNADGNPFGLGLIYFLSNQRIAENLDMAFKGSYHTGNYDINGGDFDVDGLSLEVLFSGEEPLNENGLGWYGNLGFHRLTVKSFGSDRDNEIGFGGGFTLPAGPGEAYAGVDFIDEMMVGVGFRYSLK